MRTIAELQLVPTDDVSDIWLAANRCTRMMNIYIRDAGFSAYQFVFGVAEPREPASVVREPDALAAHSAVETADLPDRSARVEQMGAS